MIIAVQKALHIVTRVVPSSLLGHVAGVAGVLNAGVVETPNDLNDCLEVEDEHRTGVDRFG